MTHNHSTGQFSSVQQFTVQSKVLAHESATNVSFPPRPTSAPKTVSQTPRRRPSHKSAFPESVETAYTFSPSTYCPENRFSGSLHCAMDPMNTSRYGLMSRATRLSPPNHSYTTEEEVQSRIAV